MNLFDLQIQSTASDGKHSPREIVQMAKERGLSVISLTDHDTVDGVPEALAAGGELGVRVIPGIEMSVEEHDAHILGYGIDYKNPELLAELEKSKQGRIEGAKKMVENLKAEGFVVEWEDVLKEAPGGIIARPHIAKAVLNKPENKDKLGGIATYYEFIEKHLATGGGNFVRRTYITAKNAIKLIHDAGGLAVWSHPVAHFRGDYDGLEKFLQELIGWEMDGVEIFTPSHTEDDVEFVAGLVQKHRLLRTAGSDFHEKGEHAEDPKTGLHSAGFLGDYETYGFPTDDIIPKLDEAIEG